MPIIYSIEDHHLLDCAKMYVDIFNAEPWNDKWTIETAHKRLQDIFYTPNFLGLVYIENQTVLGAVFGNCEEWYEGKHYNLKEMLVLNKCQGKGIGSTILKELEAQLRGLEVRTIILFTSRGNETHNFYIKNGYDGLESMVMMAKEI